MNPPKRDLEEKDINQAASVKKPKLDGLQPALPKELTETASVKKPKLDGLQPALPKELTETASVKKPKLDGLQPALPKELTKLFQPLSCALCKSELSSPVTAAGHYTGKPHLKKVKQYLSQNFPELLFTEERSSTQKKSDASDQACMSLTPDQASSCRICNVVFAGPIAAQSHYVGKKHRSKVFKGYKPIEPVPGMSVVEDASGRFGIGESFRKKEESVCDPIMSEAKRSVQKLYCDICDIQTTNDNQYKTHLGGKKHMKNVDKMKLVNVNPKDSILSSVKHKVGEDISMHKTPSGEYYCKVCDLTVNSVSQLTDHQDSKKHKKKTANASTPTS